jgi:predicted small secreted protein
MKRVAFPLLLVIALAGCGTVEGIGNDISSGARTVQGWF